MTFVNFPDCNCRSVMRILPRHLRDLIHVTDIAADHRNLFELSPMAANIAFIEVLKHWPLYGATFFDVTVSARSKDKVTNLTFSVDLRFTVVN